MTMNVHTPGVYIREKSVLPASVAGVSTSVPFFIGCTQKGGTDPVRIASMFDFENVFGGGYSPNFTPTYDGGGNVENVFADFRFMLYDSLHLYFLNGGGPCHIISAGNYGAITSLTDLKTGINTAIAKIDVLDEVTLISIPDLYASQYDSVGATLNTLVADYGTIAGSVLEKCKNLKDKFALFDYPTTDTTTVDVRSAMPTEENKLKYGAVYYPWLNTVGTLKIGFDQISGATSTGSTEETAVDTIKDDLNTLQGKFGGVFQTVETLRADFNAVTSPLTTKAQLKNVLGHLYGLVQNIDNNTVTTDPVLNNYRSSLSTNTNFTDAVKHLFWMTHQLKNDTRISSMPANHPDDTWVDDMYVGVSDYATLTGQFASLGYTSPVLSGSPSTADYNAAILADLESGTVVDMEAIFSAIAGLFSAAKARKTSLEQALFANDAIYKSIQDKAAAYMKPVPTQGAVAGIYCRNDRDRGVWKSPANMAVQGIEGPVVEVSNAEQDALNVDVDNGKSINVIRTFTGKGSLVWGARTLAAASNEWRYVSVRRFYNYAEESIKKAMNHFVFEPNNARTWVKIKAMVTSFLVEQWKAGALVGTKLDEAFFVNIGEDTTSPEEILEGKINVQIGMAVARPAEFIIIEFSHYTK